LAPTYDELKEAGRKPARRVLILIGWGGVFVLILVGWIWIRRRANAARGGESPGKPNP
jgi:hypothetical protein